MRKWLLLSLRFKMFKAVSSMAFSPLPLMSMISMLRKAAKSLRVPVRKSFSTRFTSLPVISMASMSTSSPAASVTRFKVWLAPATRKMSNPARPFIRVSLA
jgi:hypothetical protein